MTNVVIADPGYLVRKGFKTIIEETEYISLIGEITNRIEFWTKLKYLKPDILVVKHGAKVQILSYYKDSPANPSSTDIPRLYKFKYVYQPDGSRNFQ